MYSHLLTQARKGWGNRKTGLLLPASVPIKQTFGSIQPVLQTWLEQVLLLWNRFISTGITEDMEEYERRKLRIFNQLNLLGIITGLVVPIVGLSQSHLPALAFVVALSPALVASLVLICNSSGNYRMGQLYFFIFYPLFTSLPYAAGMDLGVELFFILYGMLSVFFLQRLRVVLACFGFSALLYLLIIALGSDYAYRLKEEHYIFYFLNHLLPVFFIFYGLYLIKREHTGYQQSILSKNEQLQAINAQIQAQEQEIRQKAELLEEQAARLRQLDSLKNKLFSVIAHDLKGPMYALRNLFQTIHQRNLPGEEIKLLLPEVVHDLNETTALMQNLLQWAKLQMQSATILPQALEAEALIRQELQLLKRQADAKRISVEVKCGRPAFIYADKEMTSLVVRNLVSNAIKFTPEHGRITVGIIRKRKRIEIFVEDTGVGMTRKQLQALQGQEFFTTYGTANESGTGLGIMLCREFLSINGGELSIKSRQGKGSVFAFALPAVEGEKAAS